MCVTNEEHVDTLEELAKELNYTYKINLENLKRDIDYNTKVDITKFEKFKFVILNEDNNKINIAITKNFDFELIKPIEIFLDKKVNYILTSDENISTILKLIKTCSIQRDVNEESIDEYEVNKYLEENTKIKDINKISTKKIVNKIFIDAYRKKASDIHLEPTEDSFNIRLRIHGILEFYEGFNEEFKQFMINDEIREILQNRVISRIKLISKMDVANKRKPQDARYGVMLNNGNYIEKFSMRISTLPIIYKSKIHEKIVLRILDENSLKNNISDLEISDKKLTELFKKKIEAPYGLILVTGPTGSGKTTTLYSALKSINIDKRNVVTVEDPVEYQLNGIHQMEVKSEIGLDFATGLRAILRQDPDVIMVGEIRDKETATIAVRASLTGHIVFSTLHANSATDVINRLKNIGIEEYLIASSLSLVISQRLIRVLCECKKEVSDKKKYLKDIGIDKISLKKDFNIDIDEIDTFYEPSQKGCIKCSTSGSSIGYSGRIAIFEFFDITSKVKESIIDKTKIKDDFVNITGMKTLNDEAIKLLKGERSDEYKTSLEEVLKVLSEKVEEDNNKSETKTKEDNNKSETKTKEDNNKLETEKKEDTINQKLKKKRITINQKLKKKRIIINKK